MDAILAYRGENNKLLKMGERPGVSPESVELVGEWQGNKRARYRRVTVDGDLIGPGWIDTTGADGKERAVSGLCGARLEMVVDDMRAPTNVFVFVGYDKKMFEERWTKISGLREEELA